MGKESSLELEVQRAILKALESIERNTKHSAERNSPTGPEDQTYFISATVPYIIDYKERTYIYLFSANTLTLTLEDIGTVTLTANTWTNLNFTPGIRVFASGQAANVPILVRCCNDAPATASSGGGGGGGNVNVTQWGSVNTTLGQKVMASSVPVVVASDQGAFPVTANAGTNLNTSGLALEAGGHLASIDTHTPAQGQATMANSSPVVLASDQSNVPINNAQWGGSNTTLGQKTMAASVPVVLASDESNVPTNNAQWGGSNTSLGQKTMAASVPVVLASDESNVPTNIVQLGGSAVGINNPFITQDQIRNWINNGQGFSATTNKITVTSSFGGLSIFNPNGSGKTLIIFSLKYMIGGNAYNQINYTTSDPALGTVVTPVNLRAGSGTASVASGSLNVTGLSTVGTLADMTANGSNANAQALAGGELYIIPANNGIVFYLNGTGATAYASFGWVEI